MPLTIETISYTLPNSVDLSSSSSSVSSSSNVSIKPTISLTLSGIESARNHGGEQRYLHVLYQRYPSLFHLMPYVNYTFQRKPQRQLTLTYQGKGAVRALIRGILAQNESTLPENSTIIISPMARKQAEQIREQLVQTLSPPTPKERALYAPSTTTGSVSMGHSLGGVEKQTIGDNTYIMHTVWGASRRIGDIIAGLAELATHLSAGQSPRSESFNNGHGERITVGSLFNPDAITVEEHLSSLSEDERRVFIETHALQWGECTAWNLYLGQADAHLRNIMFDKRTQRLFILDFDKCYALQTGKYSNLRKNYFPPISQYDIQSPLKPVDRLFDNWFSRHQEYLTTSRQLHTLIKLQVLPGIDSIYQSHIFKVGYYSSLYACARLTREHLHACFSKHIANPTLLDAMCTDFLTRSTALQQQLFSLPWFIHFYRQYAESFSRLLSLMSWGDRNPTLLDEASFKLACQEAITAKCDELQQFDKSLLGQLIERADDEATGLWHRRAELELTTIDELITCLPTLFDEEKSAAITERLKQIKASITQTKAVMTIPGVEKIALIREAINQFSQQAIPTNSDMALMRSGSFAGQVSLVSDRIQEFSRFFKDHFEFLVLLEHYQDPFLFELSPWLISIGKPYVTFFNYVIERISNHRLMRITFDDLKNNPNHATDIRKIKNYCIILSKTIQRLPKIGLISLLDYFPMAKLLKQNIDYLHLSEIEAKCTNGQYPSSMVKGLTSTDEKLSQSTLLDLQTPVARKLLLTHITHMTSAFINLVKLYKLDTEKQRVARLLRLYTTPDGISLFNGVMMQISRLITAFSGDFILPPYPASLTPTSIDPQEAKVTDLLSYYQDYKAVQEAVSTNINQLEQLHSIIAQLYKSHLISDEEKDRLHTMIMECSQHKHAFINHCQQQEQQALIYLQRFKTIYDHEATTWKRSLTPSIFTSSPISRPTTLEQQYQLYQSYINNTLNAWTAWVGIHALGRQAIQVTGPRRFMRDADAQTYYESFPSTPEMSWQSPATSSAASSSPIHQPPSPSF